MFDGKKKAVTFSYDDGVLQDIRLIKLFDKYKLKATFNLNSQLLGKKGRLMRKGVWVNHNKIQEADVKYIYENHEVAAHTLTHPNLTQLTDCDIIQQVETDRKNLERLTGKKVVGMAYPGGGINYNKHVVQVIKAHTGIKYARTTNIAENFNLQSHLYEFRPHVYHVMNMEELFTTGKRFLEEKEEQEKILYVWGHSYEFDIANTWGKFEEFLEMISGRENIFYGTNSQVLLGKN